MTKFVLHFLQIIDECSPDKNLKNSLMAKYQRYWNNFLNGNMKDRHLFSMFCYENFVSLEYFPYIVSGGVVTSICSH